MCLPRKNCICRYFIRSRKCKHGNCTPEQLYSCTKRYYTTFNITILVVVHTHVPYKCMHVCIFNISTQMFKL